MTRPPLSKHSCLVSPHFVESEAYLLRVGEMTVSVPKDFAHPDYLTIRATSKIALDMGNSNEVFRC